jgi:hypothetical protein
VWPFGVVPFDPLSNGGASFAEAGEVMLPDALFFEAAEKAFDEAVLFGGVGCDEFLPEAVISPLSERTTGRARGAQGAEARQAGLFEGAFGFLGAAAQGEFKAVYFAVVTIDNCS